MAGNPEVVDAVELTEEVAQPDTDSQLLPTEAENGEEILDEDEGVQGVTVEEGTPFEVPALIDRPLDIEEGPYMVVKEFNMIDAEDSDPLNAHSVRATGYDGYNYVKSPFQHHRHAHSCKSNH